MAAVGLGVRQLTGSPDLVLPGTFPEPGPNNYVLVENLLAAGTSNGTLTQGAWRTRLFNTEVSDDGTNVVLASNRVTLDPGTYIVFGISMVGQPADCYCRLFNTTDSTVVLLGTSEYAEAISSYWAYSHIMGMFTIGLNKALELQHWIEQPGSGGNAANVDPTRQELFSVLEFIRIA